MKFLFVFLTIFITTISYAQNSFFTSAKNVSVDYNDAPIRTVLEQMLKQSEIKNYLISNDVEGLVTLKLHNYNFESALKILIRANKVPLLYKIENNILIVEKRKESILIENKKPDITLTEQNDTSWHLISLKYIDPMDLQLILGRVLNLNQFTRYKNNGNFNNNLNNMPRNN